MSMDDILIPSQKLEQKRLLTRCKRLSLSLAASNTFLCSQSCVPPGQDKQHIPSFKRSYAGAKNEAEENVQKKNWRQIVECRGRFVYLI